jgi:uracil-DNA glycosylase
MKPLLLGEAPNYRVDDGRPLAGRIATRLTRTLGWVEGDPYDRLLERFDVRNVVEDPAHAYPWNHLHAAASWEKYAQSRDDRFVVVALGRRSAAAVGHADVPFYTWERYPRYPGYDAVSVPHPSGLSRIWNDASTPVRVRETLHEALVRPSSYEAAER